MLPSTGEMTGPEFRYRSKQALAGLIPIAGLVDHGPHLASGSEIELVGEYSHRLTERLHPYLFLNPIVLTTLSERSLLPSSESAFKAAILESSKGLKTLRIERTAILCNGKKDLEACQTVLGQIPGKKKALGLWQNYPKVPELEGEDPLSPGNPFLTSQILYLRPSMAKLEMMKYADPSFGVTGDPKKANPEIGLRIFGQTFEALVSDLDSFMRE